MTTITHYTEHSKYHTKLSFLQQYSIALDLENQCFSNDVSLRKNKIKEESKFKSQNPFDLRLNIQKV